LTHEHGFTDCEQIICCPGRIHGLYRIIRKNAIKLRCQSQKCLDWIKKEKNVRKCHSEFFSEIFVQLHHGKFSVIFHMAEFSDPFSDIFWFQSIFWHFCAWVNYNLYVNISENCLNILDFFISGLKKWQKIDLSPKMSENGSENSAMWKMTENFPRCNWTNISEKNSDWHFLTFFSFLVRFGHFWVWQYNFLTFFRLTRNLLTFLSISSITK